MRIPTPTPRFDRLDLASFIVVACAACGRGDPEAPRSTGRASDAAASTAASSAVEATSAAVIDPVASFCRPIADARAGALASSCPSAADRAARLYGEQLDLFASAYETCRQWTTPPSRHYRFDAAKAKQCIDAIRKGIEGDPMSKAGISDHPACADVFEGTELEGQPCTQIVECSSGLTCVVVKGAPSGVCKRPGRDGDECGWGENRYLGKHPPCEGGLYCDGAHCRQQLAAGSSCSGDPHQCASGLRCRARQCALPAPGGEGAVCASMIPPDCDRGFYCDAAGITDKGVCVRKRATGSPCENDEECVGRCSVGQGTRTHQSGVTKGACVTFCGSG